MKLTKAKLKEMIKEELNEGKLLEESYGMKFAGYLNKLDELAQDLNYWALKAIPHRKKDINDSLKLYKQLYKKVESLLKKDIRHY